MKTYLAVLLLLLAGCASSNLGELLSKTPNYEVEYRKVQITPAGEKVIHTKEGVYHDANGMMIAVKTVMWDPDKPDRREWLGVYQGKLYTCSFSQKDRLCLDAGNFQQPPKLSTKEIMKSRYGDKAKISSAEGKEIAGIQGTCFKATTDSFTEEMCLSQDGIELYSKRQFGDDAVESTALSVNIDVRHEEFAPPAKLKTEEEVNQKKVVSVNKLLNQ